MFNQAITEVVMTNWNMVHHNLLEVPEDGLVFREEYRALQSLLLKYVYVTCGTCAHDLVIQYMYTHKY